MTKIDFKLDKCPQNIPVEVYYPDGTLLIVTDNDIEFDYIRNVISDNNAEGYYITFKGIRYNILPNGRINNWPYGMFDTHSYLLARILCKEFKNENYCAEYNKTIWEDLENRNEKINKI